MTQYETTLVQHDTTEVRHEDNTSTTQTRTYFDLLVSLLHARSLVY